MTIPKCPSKFPKEAARFWRKWLPVVMEEGIVQELDLAAWEELCQVAGEIKAARSYFVERQEVIAEKHGKVRPGDPARATVLKGQKGFYYDPVWNNMKALKAQFWEGLDRFGMTPAGRKELMKSAAGPEPDEDEFDI